MAGTFDAVMKQLLDACAPDWVGFIAPLVGLPAGVPAAPLDPDLSTVQPDADKVFRLGPPGSGLLHLEPQSSWDDTLPGRLLVYNVLLEHRHGGPVYTVALLLRREANSPRLTGTLARADAAGREYLRFGYTVVRVWELAADALLAGPLGAATLAPLTDDAAPRLGEVVGRFAGRVDREARTAADATLLLTCGSILMGLRYDEAVIRSLFHGVQNMRESSTVQMFLNEGREEGRREGQARALAMQQDNVLVLLRERFGAVPQEVEARVRAATDPAKLQAALVQVLRIARPADLTI